MFLFQLPYLPERLLTRRDAAVLTRMYLAEARDRSRFGPDDLRPFRDAIQQPGAATAMLGWYRALKKSPLFDRARAREYPVIRAKTLLLWGTGDSVLGFDDLVPGTEKCVPELDVSPIDECGHFVHAEAPDPVNQRLVEFLKI